MTDYKELILRLKSLTVFRALLSEKPAAKLLTLLEGIEEGMDRAGLIELYCGFVYELYKTGDSITDWLVKYISEEENLYVKYIIEGKRPAELLCESLENELFTLTALSELDCGEIKDRICADLPLPRWKSEKTDIRSIFEKRVDEIPTKGYGIFAKYHMFTLDGEGLVPVRRPDPQRMSVLYGYEEQREKVFRNTLALVEGRPAANVLLYGDAGTGKSSAVKAVANELRERGVRLVEVKKNQLYLLPGLMDTLEGSPLKFIIFIDDLSFNSGDGDFAALKAILEGGVSGRGKNIAVYATSNRRHLVKETMGERSGDDIHLSDTLQELKSLSARFGLTVTFIQPDKELYLDIVENLAAQYGLDTDREELRRRAEAYALRGSGRSPRTAKQFVELMKAGIM